MVESKFASFLRFNQKGQGMIEYLLLLVITISMILLAMTNLFRPMQKFMQDFMGTYVACLLSSGELPAIRSTNSLKDAEPKCNFSLVGGNAQFNNGQGSGGGNSGTGSNNQNSANTSSNSSNNSKGKDGGGSAKGPSSEANSSSGSNSYAGSAGRRTSSSSGFMRRSSDSSSGGDMAGEDGGKRYVNNLDKNGNDRFFRGDRRGSNNSGRNGRGIALGGLTEEDQKKIERKIQSSPRAIPKSNEEFSVPGKKTIVKPPPPKQKIAAAEKEEGFTIGNFLKYIIIAVILLLILILGGGQAFEMSKSMD